MVCTVALYLDFTMSTKEIIGGGVQNATVIISGINMYKPPHDVRIYPNPTKVVQGLVFEPPYLVIDASATVLPFALSFNMYGTAALVDASFDVAFNLTGLLPVRSTPAHTCVSMVS